MPNTSITIFLDSADREFEDPTKLFSGIDRYQTSELSEVLGRDVDSEFSRYVLAVTGHGRDDGRVQAEPDLLPQDVLDAVKTIPRLGSGAILLGQCYAGSFNYLDVRDSKICIAAGTNLSPSLSLPTTIAEEEAPFTDFDSPRNWVANQFIFFFFAWMCLRIDIDGDDKVSILDGFKYAGINSSSHLQKYKEKNLGELLAQISKRTRKTKLKKTSSRQKLSLMTQESLSEAVGDLFTEQFPWLLNAHIARDFIL